MTKCAAQRMSDAWGGASGAAGVAGTVAGLFNAWTGLGLGTISASQWLTTIALNNCSRGFTSNIVITMKNGQILSCSRFSGSVGGGTF